MNVKGKHLRQSKRRVKRHRVGKMGISKEGQSEGEGRGGKSNTRLKGESERKEEIEKEGERRIG